MIQLMGSSDELRMREGKHKKEAIQGKDWDYV